MKKYLPGLAVLFAFLILSSLANEAKSQTSGTFSFSVLTNAPAGDYFNSNLLAIWIENSQASFIKTKIKYGGSDVVDHLIQWVSKSGQNVTDATTGATRTGNSTVTFLWNGTNVAGTVVPDGNYLTWLEMAWGRSTTLGVGRALNSFTFTKGATAFHSNPANTDFFLSLVLDWTPTTTGVEGMIESRDINVYPNPTDGLLKIDFRNPSSGCQIRIINEAGTTVYHEQLSEIHPGTRTLDLTRLEGGTYYCTLRFPEKDIVFTIILLK